jgi:endonuclease/exonuclease/phosphatase family metal-dependent hydrolase
MNNGTVVRALALTVFSMLLVACASPDRLVQPPIVHHVNEQSDARAQRVVQNDLLRVMTLNIGHARGTGTNQMLQAADTARTNLDSIVLQLKLEAPDVVSLQEIDKQSFWNGRFDHVSFIAEQGAFTQSVSGTHVKSVGLDYGTALVARLDLGSPESVVFNPSDVSAPKGFIVSSIRWPGNECIEVDVVSAHLDPVSAVTRREQAAEIIATLKQRNRPVILTGDFNGGWHHSKSALRKMAEELGLHPFEPDDLSMVTFPKHNRRLDWILVSSEINFESYRVVETQVSDHLGVISDLSINRGCG